MTREEQNLLLNKEYAEAMRYMDNAKATLAKAKKNDDGCYEDQKYVRVACGTAYSGVLVAMDAWFVLKNAPPLPKDQRKSIDYYKWRISQLDKKMLAKFNTTYNILHLWGYYDGEQKVSIVKSGFETAYEIIDRIKPEQFIELPKTSPVGGFKKFLTTLFTFGMGR